MRTVFILAVAAILPSSASAVTVIFGGVFGANVPVTAFSRPGDRFRIEFDTPTQFRNGGNQVFATYTTRGVTQQRNAFFNLGSPGLPQGFTFAPGELFSNSGFSISFQTRRPFYEVVEGNIVRLTQNAQLFNGRASSTRVSTGIATGDILNPTALRIIDGPEPCPILNFDDMPSTCRPSGSLTSFSTAGRATLGLASGDLFQSSAPEPGTWVMLIAGFGAVGASMRRHKRAGLAA